jgi:hypothetical protein
MRIFPLYVATLLAALLLAWLSLTYKRGLLPITIADERIDWSPQLAPFGDERPFLLIDGATSVGAQQIGRAIDLDLSQSCAACQDAVNRRKRATYDEDREATSKPLFFHLLTEGRSRL